MCEMIHIIISNDEILSLTKDRSLLILLILRYVDNLNTS